MSKRDNDQHSESAGEDAQGSITAPAHRSEPGELDRVDAKPRDESIEEALGEQQPPTNGVAGSYRLENQHARAQAAEVGVPSPEREPLSPEPIQAVLAGEPRPVVNASLPGLADALLRSPASLLHELDHRRASVSRFVLLIVLSMLAVGAVVASFSGGYQYIAVPLKLAVGLVFGAALCLPSLYIFNCLSGARHSLRNVLSALLMGIGVQALLLLGFAPIAWIFSQSTTSVGFMGGLYIVLLLVSGTFGLGMMRRALSSTGSGGNVLWLWNVMFVVVLLQLTTNLRPVVGEFKGWRLQPKQFFLAHWMGASEGKER